MPDHVAVAAALPRRWGRGGYQTLTFRQLDEDSTRLAAALRGLGVERGMRLALLVKPGVDFVSLTFALFKAGVIVILIDPGMGRRNLVACLEEAAPDGFIAISLAQAARVLLARRFPRARFNVTVGRRWFWGGPTLAELRDRPVRGFQPVDTAADEPAAIIFTTGSTGPPKGVLYRHGNFCRQVDEIQEFYGIEPGGVDLSGFPLFALFNGGMGVTTVIPDMDATRPARVDPRNILRAAADWRANQAFGSPALWNAVGRFCERTGAKLPTLRLVLSAGAPVPPHVLRRMKNAIDPAGEMHTPYGATEALPVASISASQVLGETAERSAAGAGTCVGGRFRGIEWKVIGLEDGPLPSRADCRQLPRGEIGELMVRGPVVTTEYATRVDQNALHKVADQGGAWHRLGDVGYLDEADRFWFCGRKGHRVRGGFGTLFTIPCEAIFNGHPRVYRSALVGLGARESQTPVVVVEPWPEHRPRGRADEARLLAELRELALQHSHTRHIEHFLVKNELPVDIRHNAKIFRERLAEWAARRAPERAS